MPRTLDEIDAALAVAEAAVASQGAAATVLAGRVDTLQQDAQQLVNRLNNLRDRIRAVEDLNPDPRLVSIEALDLSSEISKLNAKARKLRRELKLEASMPTAADRSVGRVQRVMVKGKAVMRAVARNAAKR